MRKLLTLVGLANAFALVVAAPASASFGLTAKWGTLETGDGKFESPSRIGIDAGDNVYVAELLICI